VLQCVHQVVHQGCVVASVVVVTPDHVGASLFSKHNSKKHHDASSAGKAQHITA
jgi:hypothetical protein